MCGVDAPVLISGQSDDASDSDAVCVASCQKYFAGFTDRDYYFIDVKRACAASIKTNHCPGFGGDGSLAHPILCLILSRWAKISLN